MDNISFLRNFKFLVRFDAQKRMFSSSEAAMTKRERNRTFQKISIFVSHTFLIPFFFFEYLV